MKEGPVTLQSAGPLTFGSGQQEVFLGRDFGARPDYSEDTARQIDAEIRKIVTSCYEKSKNLLTENLETLKRVSEGFPYLSLTPVRCLCPTLIRSGCLAIFSFH